MDKVILLFFLLFCVACESAILNHAKARYSECSVEEHKELSNGITVVVKCPYEEPFYKTFREK
jgi:hypothetical protein